MSQADLKQLLLIIEQQLDWGDAASWQGKDFERLNELILEKTKISLSASTLRRIFGRVEYNHMPSGTTLDTLAQFADFENWRMFTRQRTQPSIVPKAEQDAAKPKAKRGIFPVVILAVIALVTLTLVGMHVRNADEPVSGTIIF